MSAIMNALRKAGSRLNEFDASYADKLADIGGGSVVNAFGVYGRAVPLEAFRRDVFPMSQYESMDGIGPRTAINARVGGMIDKGLLAANIASRYALPAGGITLAGQGLYDLTAQFGNEADYAQPGELPLS